MKFAYLSTLLTLSSFTHAFVANNATLVKLTNAAQQHGAVSLDGSPGAIYVHIDAEPRKIIILQRGGAWCTSIGDCYSRSQSTLGSTQNYPTEVDLNLANEVFGGEPFPILSNNQTYSPQFWNWTKVFLPYTDGGSQVGDLTDPIRINNSTSMYFRGYRILQSIQEYLSNYGNQICNPTEDIGCGILQDATDVVITGGSAGALSVYLHADQWVNYIGFGQNYGKNYYGTIGSSSSSSSSSSSATVTPTITAIPDSGFFMDYNGGQVKNQSWHDQMVWVVEAMNGTNHLPTLCLAANPTNRTKCFFAEHVAPFIQVPLFALQSEYDQYQISAELHAPSTDDAAINAYGTLLTETIYSTLINSSSKHGMFLDSCYHHTRYWGEIIINGYNCAEAIQLWYNAVQKNDPVALSQRVWFQNQTYPCVNCCNGGN